VRFGGELDSSKSLCWLAQVALVVQSIVVDLLAKLLVRSSCTKTFELPEVGRMRLDSRELFILWWSALS